MVDQKMTMTGLGEMALGVLALIVIISIIPMIGSSIDTAASVPRDTAATGVLAFTSNVSNGELVNITYGTAVYRFEFNTSGNPDEAAVLTANAIRVNASDIGSWNTSVRASGNLTAAMNANASVAALLTAVNTTNTTTITADATGTAYNAVALSENGAGIAWSHATLTGGVDGSAWSGDDIPTGSGMWAVLGPFIQLAAIILIVAGFLTTLKGLKKD